MRWLTWDPPFGGEKAAFQWPQELKMNRGARAISLLLVVSFAVGLTRPLQWLKQLIAACRRRAVAVRAFSGVALLWAIDLLVSAGTRLEVTLHGEARRTGYNYDRVWTTIQCTRPEVIAGAVAVAVVLLGTMTPSWRLWSRLRRLFARLKLDGQVGLAVGAVLAVSQLVSGLLVWSSLHGWSGAFKVGHPAVLTPVGGALLAALLKWWAGRSSSNGDIWRLARDSSWLRWLSAPVLFAVGGVGVAASQAAGTWTYGYLLATWGITVWLVIRAAQAGHSGDLRRVGLAGWGVAALTVTVLASALLTRLWPLMEEPGRYAMKLIIASPDTAALVGLLFGLAFIYLGQRSRWLDLHAYITSELVSVIERPALRTALPVVAALVLSSSYVFGLLPELGLHFSQKHLLERTGVDPRDPSGVLDEDGHPRVFKYAPSGGGSVTRNFYTQAMPSLIDKGALNKLLAGQDFATQISDFGPEGRSLAMALPGWPSTGEYKPQRGLYFGVAAKVEGRNITVAANAAGLRPSWQENQWRGATLVSGRGQRVQVVSNTADTLEVDTEPALTIGDAQRASFHLLPEGTTLLPKSTATRREQRFVVVPKDDFSALNFAYRRANKGHHISVIDARSSQLVLTATHLKEGQKDDSWIRDHVLNRAAFDAIKGVKKTEVNFDDKVFLVGYHLKTPTVRRSRKYELDLYFEVRSGLASSYMIFMHPHPLHRDLWPLALHPKTKREEKRCTGCFQTNHGLKGDIVRVPVVQEVPLGTSAGQHDIIFGLYNPLNEKRLILKGGKGSGVFVHRDNRVTLTRLTVR